MSEAAVQPKWFAKSKTFIGIAISMMGGLSQTFGWSWWDLISADVLHGIELLFTFGGLVFAAIGRVKADAPVKLTP